MKKLICVLTALPLLFSCSPENNDNDGDGKGNDGDLTITGEALDVTDVSATFTGYANLPLEFGTAEVGILYDKGQSFESAKKVVATGLDGNNKFTVTASGLESNTTYYFKSYVQNGMAIKYGAVKSFTTLLPAGVVDLGIVMTRENGTTYRLYWAKSNLSEAGLCANPEESGDLYSWGETGTKKYYSWSNYKFGIRYSGPFSKYNTSTIYGSVDHLKVLETGPDGDDVVSRKLGGKWRMPTDAEWTALKEKCDWTWTTQNGMKGRQVTSSNGNSIFLPAAGLWSDSKLSNVGSRGYYWSSSLNKEFPFDAWDVYFDSNEVRKSSSYYRCFGLSVRPVFEE